jgi:hypothetical protein
VSDVEEITLTTGRILHANRGIIGIGPNLSIHQGYDGDIPYPSEEWHERGEAMTDSEVVELANIAIDRWTRLRSAALRTITTPHFRQKYSP